MPRPLVLLAAAIGLTLASLNATAQTLTRDDCDRMAEALRQMATVAAQHRLLLAAHGNTQPMQSTVDRAERMMNLYRELVGEYAELGCGRLLPIARD